VVWRAFPLHPETPAEGRSLEDLFAGMPVKVADIIAGLKQKAEELGLPFGNRSRTYNSRLAQELGLWAEDQGCGHRFHLLAFHAYFADGRNLARREVLLDLARQAGLSPSQAEVVLKRRLFRKAVDADWERSRQLGITAVPTFVAGGQKVVGAQPYEVLEKLVS
jgi:predicted DsbA family dithiol-disulfide isomerase